MCVGYLYGKKLACGKMRINVFTYMDEDMKFKMIKTVLALFLILSVTACSQEKSPKPDTPLAKTFNILNIEEFAAPGDKKRYRLTIYSKEAKTFEERAQTAINAAYVTHNADKDIYEVDVWLEALPKISERVAYVSYYPYKESAWGGKENKAWKTVESSNYQITGDKVNSLDIILKKYPIN